MYPARSDLGYRIVDHLTRASRSRRAFLYQEQKIAENRRFRHDVG